jgi:hypothetical protein
VGRRFVDVVADADGARILLRRTFMMQTFSSNIWHDLMKAGRFSFFIFLLTPY